MTPLLWGLFSTTIGVAFGLVIATIAFSKRIHFTEMRCAREMEATLAAEWLARYNYGYMIAMQEAVHREASIGYARLQELMHEQLNLLADYGKMGQLIPLERVPDGLKEGARLFNSRVTMQWALPYTKMIHKESDQEIRIRQLQDAVAILRVTDDHCLTDDKQISLLARKAGVSFENAEAVLNVLLFTLHGRADYVLGVPDPEEILPSIH